MPVMPNSDPTKPRAALFRARDDAARSAARLRRLGFAVARLPAIEIIPLAFTAKRKRYDAVVAASDKAFLEDVSVDRASPLYVVGARTARAAAALGWRLAAPPAPDSQRLAETLKGAMPRGATVLYLAGRDRKPAIEVAFAGTEGFELAEVYAAEPRQSWSSAEIRALESCRFALHYSRRSAALALDLASAGGAAPQFRLMTHVCLSNDVGEPLRAFGAACVRVAVRPDEAALLATLRQAAAVFSSQDPSRI
jgi:uroporphyrinogen-III synthase